MFRAFSFALALMFLFPILLLAQSGKLRGTVTDRENGEPLIGANVVVEGTTMGGSTDLNGEYIILNVPPGVYTIRASYIGYAPFAFANIRVNSNLTTTQDIALAKSTLQVQEVVVVATRPLIQRNTTNTVRMTTQENVKNLPFRGLQNILALEAGVVQQNGNLYIRGGRTGEVAFFLEGANTTNPITNAQTIGVIQEALEEVQLQAGGYTAEFGGGNSAIVRTSLRSGTPDFHASLSYQTDDFAKPGSEFLGSSAFGFRNGVVTLYGPLYFSNLKFFVAGQHNYIRDRAQRWVVPFNFEGLRVDVNDARYDATKSLDQQVLLPGAVAFKQNYIPNNWDENNGLQGTISLDLQEIKVRFTGSYDARRLPTGRNWPDALANIYRLRNPMQNQNTGFAEAKITHVLSPTTYYEVGVSYQDIKVRTFDNEMENASGPAPAAITVGGAAYVPNFRDNWNWYSDSLVSQQLGYPGFQRRYSGPFTWSTIFGFGFNDPNTPIGAYSRSSQTAWGVNADLTSQVSSTYEIKVGGRIDSWVARSYTVNSIQRSMEYLYGLYGTTPRTFESLEKLSIELAKTSAGNINYYGYDVFGNEVDSDPDGPQKPLFASAYIQNKFEFRDLILNVGARLEYYDTKAKGFADPNQYMSVFNEDLDVIDRSKLVEAEPFKLVLPRLSFSFPVTDKTVFYAMYGKYAQLASLNQLYVGNTVLSRTLSPISRGNAYLTPVGFMMKPERTTQYEMGFRQLITDNFAFSLTGFYKDLKNLLSLRSYLDPNGVPQFSAYLNEDFGTVKGLELSLDLRRTNRLSARINYTLSDARGTGSNSRSGQGAQESNIGIPSSFINPLDFNQTHRGTVMLDYRFERNDGGPILSGLGLNVLMSFNSGHGYTKIPVPTSLGQASAWTIGTYPLIDPRFSRPEEPINASTTPWVFNVDVNISKAFWIGNITTELYLNILNALDTKQVLYVYPTTGTPNDDGFLTSPLADRYKAIPYFAEFYKAINLDNQWSYDGSGRGPAGRMFGSPRQIRLGLRFEL